jgi:hypothetical protein
MGWDHYSHTAMKVEADKTMWNLPVAPVAANSTVSLIIESDPFRTELILRVRLGFLFQLSSRAKSSFRAYDALGQSDPLLSDLE